MPLAPFDPERSEAELQEGKRRSAARAEAYAFWKPIVDHVNAEAKAEDPRIIFPAELAGERRRAIAGDLVERINLVNEHLHEIFAAIEELDGADLAELGVTDPDREMVRWICLLIRDAGRHQMKREQIGALGKGRKGIADLNARKLAEAFVRAKASGKYGSDSAILKAIKSVGGYKTREGAAKALRRLKSRNDSS